MRLSLPLAAAAATALLALPATASAASTTVDGQGDIKSMKVVNGEKAVKVVLRGLEELCGGTQKAGALITWGTDAAYQVDGICVSGQWGEGLFYLDDADAPEGGKQQGCGRLKIAYADGAVRIRVPRSCIKKAANRIRVEGEGYNFGHLMGGTAGPTKRLRRG